MIITTYIGFPSCWREKKSREGEGREGGEGGGGREGFGGAG